MNKETFPIASVNGFIELHIRQSDNPKYVTHKTATECQILNFIFVTKHEYQKY